MIESINALRDAGHVSYFVVLGFLGVVSTMYIKSLIVKLESLPDMATLVKKVDELVFRVQIICNNQELQNQKYEMQLSHIETRIKKIEDYLGDSERKETL